MIPFSPYPKLASHSSLATNLAFGDPIKKFTTQRIDDAKHARRHRQMSQRNACRPSHFISFPLYAGIRSPCVLPSRPLLLSAKVSIRLSSSKRWVARQNRDVFAREAKVQGLKSRAAFKLLQIDEKYRLFKPGNTVIDLGFAPGSWSQVLFCLDSTVAENDLTFWATRSRLTGLNQMGVFLV